MTVRAALRRRGWTARSSRLGRYDLRRPLRLVRRPRATPSSPLVPAGPTSTILTPAVVDPGSDAPITAVRMWSGRHRGLGFRVVEDAWISGRAVAAVRGRTLVAPANMRLLAHPDLMVPGLVRRGRRTDLVRGPAPGVRAPAGILITAPWQSNWFHLVTDVLVRAFATRWLPAEHAELPFLVSEEALAVPAFREALIGLADGRSFVPLGSIGVHHTDRVVLVDFIRMRARPVGATEPGALLHMPTGLLEDFRRAVLASAGVSLGADEPPAGRRLFVARPTTGPGSERRRYNQDQVRDVLETYGFETVEPAAMSFADQVRAFASAGVVVGPHGAAMTGLLLTREARALLWTFRPALRRVSLFGNLGAIAGTSVTALPVDGPEGLTPAGYVDVPSYRLDPDRLRAALDLLGLGRSGGRAHG